MTFLHNSKNSYEFGSKQIFSKATKFEKKGQKIWGSKGLENFSLKNFQTHILQIKLKQTLPYYQMKKDLKDKG